MKAWTQKGPSQAGNGAGRGKLSRADRRYTSALSYSAHVGPNTSCLHPSSITHGGSFFGQGQQRLVYLRQIFVRWSHGRNLETCPSIGSVTATTIRLRLSSNRQRRLFMLG